MNNFIRKNIFLVGFLTLSALGGLALLVVAVMLHVDMSGYIQKTEEMKNEVEKLQRDRPPAVRENIRKVQDNIDGYSTKAAELRLRFGQIYRSALEAFVKKLDLQMPAGETDRVDFLQRKFREFWDEKKNSLPRGRAYQSFKNMGIEKKYWTGPKWADAMKAFQEQVEEVSEEKVDGRNIEDVFLSALGLVRTANDKDRLDLYMANLRKGMVEQLTKNNVKLVGVYFNNTNLGIAQLPDSRAFNDDNNRREGGESEGRRSSEGGSGGDASLLDKTKYPGIMRNWEIMSDLVYRIAKSKVDSLEKLNMANLEGTRQGDFTVFRYEVVVHGTTGAVRKLLNNLLDAYEKNRVYVVRNVSFRKLEDQVQDLKDMEEGLLAAPRAETEGALELGDGPSQESAEESSRTAAPKEKAPVQSYFREQGVYGEVVAGRNQFCEAAIVVDYVIYSAKEIE